MMYCADCSTPIMAWSNQVPPGNVVICGECKKKRDKLIQHELITSVFTCSCGSKFLSLQLFEEHVKEFK